jgi:hypothetical protein
VSGRPSSPLRGRLSSPLRGRLSSPLRGLLLASVALTVAVAGGATQAHAQEPLATVRVRLSADTLVDGIRCAHTGRAYAEFFVASGRLAECPLAHDDDVGGHSLPAGTWVILDAEGRLSRAWLSRDTRIGSMLCKGTGYKDWITEFHPDGALRMCFLAEPETIQGIPCRKGTFWGEVTGGVGVYFHEDGRLRSCGLARSVTIEGVRYRRWERIWLDPEGRPTTRPSRP